MTLPVIFDRTIKPYILILAIIVLACSKLAVTYFVAYVSPQDGKWHQSVVV